MIKRSNHLHSRCGTSVLSHRSTAMKINGFKTDQPLPYLPIPPKDIFTLICVLLVLVLEQITFMQAVLVFAGPSLSPSPSGLVTGLVGLVGFGGFGSAAVRTGGNKCLKRNFCSNFHWEQFWSRFGLVWFSCRWLSFIPQIVYLWMPRRWEGNALSSEQWPRTMWARELPLDTSNLKLFCKCKFKKRKTYINIILGENDYLSCTHGKQWNINLIKTLEWLYQDTVGRHEQKSLFSGTITW